MSPIHQMISVHFSKYKVKVNNANWPAIKIDTNNDAAFPWEVLMVLPNQRIPVEKMNERLSSELLRVGNEPISKLMCLF